MTVVPWAKAEAIKQPFFSSSLKKELLGCKVIVSFLSVRPVIILGTV